MAADPDRADGSPAHPFSTLAAALASGGARLRLAPGVYPEPLRIDRDVKVVGACPSRTFIEGVARLDDRYGVVIVPEGRRLTLRDVTLRGDGAGALVRGALVLEGARVLETENFGVWVDGGEATIRRTLIGDVRSRYGAASPGIVARGGARVRVASSAVLRSYRTAVSARGDGTTVTLDGVLIEGTRTESGSTWLVGAVAASGRASVRLHGSAIVDSQVPAAHAWGEGTELHLTASSVRGVEAPGARQGTHAAGVGLVAENHSHLRAERTVVTGARFGGAAASSAARMTLVGCRLAGNEGADAGATQGAHLQVHGCAIVDNVRYGLAADGPETVLEATANLIEGQRSVGPPEFGASGIELVDGATGILSGNAIRANRLAGVSAMNGASIESTHDLIEATRGRDDDPLDIGVGLYVIQARATASGLLVRDSTGANVQFVTGSTGELRDVAAVEARPLQRGPRAGHFGYGLVVGDQSALRADGLHLARNVAAAMVTDVSSAVLRDVLLVETRPGTAVDRHETFYEHLGDGLLSNAMPELAMEGVYALGNPRAGFLLLHTEARGTRWHAVGNAFGLVLEGRSAVMESPCACSGNHVKDVFDARALGVRSTPSLLPEPPHRQPPETP